MSEATIRTQIKTILSGVPGIGVVHEYQRWARDWTKFLNQFQDADGRINTWMFSRTVTPEKWLSNVEYIRVYEYVIRGMYGLKDGDATELIFQGVVDRICAAFRDKATLNDACETIVPEFGSLAGRAGIQVETVDVRTFGIVLCHYAELKLGAQVTEART